MPGFIQKRKILNCKTRLRYNAHTKNASHARPFPRDWGRVAWERSKTIMLNIVGTLIFAGVIIMLYKAVTEPAIAISPISVPKDLLEKGYTPEFAALQLKEFLSKIIQESHSRKKGASVTALSDEPSISLPETGLSLDIVAAQIRSILSISSYWALTGAFSREGNTYHLSVHISNGSRRLTLDKSIASPEVDTLLREASGEIMEFVDPYILASSLSSSDPSRAKEIVSRILISNSEDKSMLKWSYLLLSFIDNNTKHYDSAANEARNAIAIDSLFSLAHNNLGIALLGQGNARDAITSFQKAIELDPKFSLPYNNLGNALRKEGKSDEAIVKYRKAIKLDPAYATAHSNLGLIFEERGDHDQAILEYQKAIVLDSNYAAAYNNYGVTLKNQGKIDDAIVEFRKAIAHDRKYALPHRNLANALKEKGRFAEADAELTIAQKLQM